MNLLGIFYSVTTVHDPKQGVQEAVCVRICTSAMCHRKRQMERTFVFFFIFRSYFRLPSCFLISCRVFPVMNFLLSLVLTSISFVLSQCLASFSLFLFWHFVLTFPLTSLSLFHPSFISLSFPSIVLYHSFSLLISHILIPFSIFFPFLSKFVLIHFSENLKFQSKNQTVSISSYDFTDSL